MEVALIGFGKMGQMINRVFDEEKQIDKVYIIDPQKESKSTPEQPIYASFDKLPATHKVSAVFIASNGHTHCAVLKQMFQAGIKNIFCEKPMCLTQKEYDEIRSVMPKDTKLIVDYILRSSPALTVFQNKVKELLNQGFQVRTCNVLYGKDRTKDPGRFFDLGIYDELYHVWDLCFNNPLFGKIKGIKPVKKIFYEDPTIPNRCLRARTSYLIQNKNGKKSVLNIFGSFDLPMHQRGFVFYMYKGAEKQIVSLIFDKNKEDICLHIDSQNKMDRQTFTAHQKLPRMIQAACTYFQTGQKAPFLHEATDSFHLQNTLKKMKQPYNLKVYQAILNKRRKENENN